MKFATFDVNWVTSAGPGKATDYSSGVTFTLTQDQKGGFVDLSPSPNTFTLSTTGQSDVSKVTIYISPDKAGNLPPTVDGTDLVGNLKLDAGSQVGTVTIFRCTSVVHPTDCLKVYNFVTDQDFNLGILDTTSLKVPTNGAKAGKVRELAARSVLRQRAGRQHMWIRAVVRSSNRARLKSLGERWECGQELHRSR